MKLIDVFRFNQRMLLEYDNTKSGVTLAAPGGQKASGKNYDNMIVGDSEPYKNDKYVTKYEILSSPEKH